MPALMFLLLFWAYSRPACSAVAAVAPSAAPVLPDVVRASLDQEYPGWKFAAVTTQIQQEFKKHKSNRSPCVAAGDFDHDGKRDYAVQIALTAPGQEEQIVIIFLARDNAYEETVVQSMGLDPTVYLWVPSNKDVLMVLGGPIGDTTYAYQDGKFQEIQMQEDPEHPDPSIPRPPIPL